MAEIDTETHTYDVHDQLYGPTRRFVPRGRSKPTGEARPEPAPSPAGPASQPVEAPEEPPLGGVGSGRDHWVAYAKQLGLTVDDDMTRDDIVVLTRQHTGG